MQVMQLHPKITRKAPAKDIKQETINPLHLPNQSRIHLVSGSSTPEFLANLVERS